MKKIDLPSDINDINLRQVDLNLLHIFLVLAEEHSATRAAERLGVTQAAVSAALRRLRALYQDPLFTRSQTGLVPTPKAVLLHPIIRDALAGVARSLSANLDRPASTQVRAFRLGLSDDYEICMGQTLIKRLARDAPNFRLILRQSNSSLISQTLERREVDLGLTGGGVTGTRLRRLSVGRSGYLCLFDPAIRGNDVLTMGEFIARDHILISYEGLTGVIDDVLSEQGLNRRIASATSHYAALPFLLKGSEAIATLPAHSARTLAQSSSLACCACPVALPEFGIDLSWRFDALRDPAFTLFRDLIADEATSFFRNSSI